MTLKKEEVVARYVSPNAKSLRLGLVDSTGTRQALKFHEGQLTLTDAAQIAELDANLKLPAYKTLGVLKVDKAAAEQMALAHKASKSPQAVRGTFVHRDPLVSNRLMAQAADQNLSVENLQKQLKETDGDLLLQKSQQISGPKVTPPTAPTPSSSKES